MVSYTVSVSDEAKNALQEIDTHQNPARINYICD
jgi:hypothetical protein